MFNYILDKITNAEFSEYPFKHIIIDNFLSEEHFNLIVKDSQIDRGPYPDDRELTHDLLGNGWEVVMNPGCRTSVEEYLQCLETGVWPSDDDQTKLIERFGLTFSLKNVKSEFIQKLLVFVESKEFKECLYNKFGFDLNTNTSFETHIKKYLTGYEITPHPDIRKKCLTYMLNINTDDRAEHEDIHTHILRFNKEYEYVYDKWRDETHVERCWVPWDWAYTVSKTSKNNSIILFNPDYDTLHGVKLDYNHLEFQRTQFYGNLWYEGGRTPYERGTWEKLKK